MSHNIKPTGRTKTHANPAGPLPPLPFFLSGLHPTTKFTRAHIVEGGADLVDACKVVQVAQVSANTHKARHRGGASGDRLGRQNARRNPPRHEVKPLGGKRHIGGKVLKARTNRGRGIRRVTKSKWEEARR